LFYGVVPTVCDGGFDSGKEAVVAVYERTVNGLGGHRPPLQTLWIHLGREVEIMTRVARQFRGAQAPRLPVTAPSPSRTFLDLGAYNLAANRSPFRPGRRNLQARRLRSPDGEAASSGEHLKC